MELCPPWRVEKSHHRCCNPALLDEPYHSLEYRYGVFVKADDKPCLDFKPEALKLPDTGYEVPVLVRDLCAFQQAFFVRRLDAHKDSAELSPGHHSHEVLVVGKIDGRLGREVKRMFFSVHPPDNRRQYLLLQLFLIADEVVVHKEHPAPPAKLVEFLQFPNDLLTAFSPGDPAVEGGDVAEFALERAPP